jgi:hypothetical protein
MLAGLPVLGFTTGEYGIIAHNEKVRIERAIVVELLDYCRKVLICLFVEIGYGDARREDGVVGMLGREVRGGLGSEILQNNASNEARSKSRRVATYV